MFALRKQTRTGFFIAMIGLMLTSIISPVLALSASDLVAGDDAVVASNTNLYRDASRDADVTAEVAQGTPVSIVDGPVTADDGTQWFWVRVWDQTGYMPAVDLTGVEPASPADDAADTAEDADATPTRPWQEPIDYGVANDNVKCRADASSSAAELIRVAAGQTVEITGTEVWAEGIAWLPVNCAGVGGFIASDYITRDTGETETTATEAEATEAEAVADVPAETGTSVEDPGTDEVATDTTDETQVETETGDETAATEPADIIAGPQQAPIGVATATADVVCRVDATTSAAALTVIAAGQTVEVTGDPVAGDGLGWTPVNCAGAGGFVASQYLDTGASDVPTDEADTEDVTDATAEEAATETLTEGVTDAVANETTEQTATDEAVEDATDETAVETTDEAVEDATQEATDDATEDATDDEADEATEEATEDATDGTTEEATDDEADEATEEVTEDATTDEVDDDATDEATEDATDEAVDEATEAAEAATEDATDEAADGTEPEASEEQLDSGQAVQETASTVPVDDSAIIGTAEIRGTNGAGVACRIAPDSTAPVIRVLPEGMTVLVLSPPDANGWMSIVCNDQVGFAPATYLYSGGAASDFSADKSSFANVNSTGGAGLNCRSGPGTGYSVIGYFPAGSGVNVRGAAQGDWVPVVCGGQNGWVHGAYLVPASAPSNGDSSSGGTDSGATAGTMVVSGTNGDSLYCRTAPGGTPITLMPPGTRVSVRGATENGWVPIVCAGQNGYASAQYLSAATTGDTSGGDTSNSGDTGGGVTSGTVTVTGTGGARLNCRTAPNGAVITSVPEGTVLQVRGAAEGGWQPVSCNGSNGWVSTMYITAGGNLGTAPGGSSGTGNNDSGNTSDKPDATTGTATVVNTDGDSLRCRTAPNGSTITMLPPGSTVALRAEKSGEWQGVVCAGQNGFAHSAYLSIGGTTNPPAAQEPAAPDPAPASGMGNGDHAKTTANLNLRYEPNLGSGIATAAPAGTVVLITGSATSGFYPVNWDGLKGYMSGDYLVKTDEALSKRGGSGNPTTPPPATGDGSSTATGNAIVDYAMGYLGYPYVWATHGPYSFDCSGFTYWVIMNVVGINIGTGLWTQVSAGTPVSRSNLQPGDLVFFQNTYKAGLSHVGIYIGGSQFIHAENENTGVKISDLNSNYYGSRWYGAVRIG